MYSEKKTQNKKVDHTRNPKLMSHQHQQRRLQNIYLEANKENTSPKIQKEIHHHLHYGLSWMSSLMRSGGWNVMAASSMSASST